MPEPRRQLTRRRVSCREALAIAVALSIVHVVRRSARPHDAVLSWVDRLGRYANVQLRPLARVTPGVVVYRLDDRLFFANAQYVKGRVREAVRGAPDPARWLVFAAECVTYIDATGLEALRNLAAELKKDSVGHQISALPGGPSDRYPPKGDVSRQVHVIATWQSEHVVESRATTASTTSLSCSR